MREQETLPVQLPKEGERSEGEEMFAKLVAAIDKPPKREWRVNSWICPGTWAAVDERGSKAKQDTLSGREGRKLNWRIKRLLGEDRVERARRAGESMTLLRAAGKES